MTAVLQDLSPEALARAIYQGLISHVRGIARVLPEWQVEEDGPATLIYHRHAATPLDGVLHARLAPATAEKQIERLLARFRQEGRSVLWFTGSPDDLPDLEERLLARGFHPEEPLPSMAADLEAMDLEEPLPAGLTIEPVRTAEAHRHLMQIQVQTLGEGFGPRAALKGAFGLAPEAPVQHYLGFLEGRPVASATAVYEAGVVTLYGIGTLSEARGRGVGRAMTLRPCRDASRAGYRAAALFATSSGLPVYQKLGFATYGRFRMFFRPSA
ncbi:MAG: GNAT family N-acetyltransferase [Bacillota bacterium]